jgi:FkbM family methyltransferase
MPTISFDFFGHHEIAVPDDVYSVKTATEIIQGQSYPFPTEGGLEVRTVVDLGAHVGEFTVMAAARWPGAAVHAFEPNAQVWPLLRANCQRYPNIVIYQQAVDAKAGRGQLYSNNVSPVCASLVYTEAPPPGVTWSGVEVDIVGPEAVLDLAPDVLKVDVEGVEARLFEAMGAAVTRIPIIYVEFHGEDRRIHLERMLLRTHCLFYARILEPNQGELMYVKRLD